MSRQEAIEEVTRRLVGFYRPLRIFLFGSEARGESEADSDLDFLFFVRRTYFERNQAETASLPFVAMAEGKVLYERHPV